MSIKVIMPHMGESVVEGTIIKWLKKEGDVIKKDESIVEISTDKVDVDIPAPASGILIKILAREDQKVDVGKEIALIEEAAPAEAAIPTIPAAPPRDLETLRPPAPPAAVPPPTKKEVPPKPPAAAPPRAEPPAARPPSMEITPVVGKLAAQYSVDLSKIEGTGLGGRVTKKDVLDYVEKKGLTPAPPPPATLPPPAPTPPPPPPAAEKPAPPAAPPAAPPKPEEPTELIPLLGMRRAIADHMVLSKTTIPHVTTVAEVDVTNLVDFKKRHQEEFEAEEGIPITYMPFIVKAVIMGLKEFPLINSSLEGQNIVVKKFYHIGVAVAVKEGLIVPVVRHADRLDIRHLAHAVYDAAKRAREGKLLPQDMMGGTFSITNPGVFGAILSTPIINYPQCAILGTEAIRRLPVVRGEEIVIRSMMNLCLSYDHRIVDGAYAIQFLQKIRRCLENPLELIL